MKFLLALIVFLSLSLSSLAFSETEDNRLSQYTRGAEALIIERAEKIGVQGVSMTWTRDEDGHYIADIAYKGFHGTMPFSKEEIIAIETKKADPKTLNKIDYYMELMRANDINASESSR